MRTETLWQRALRRIWHDKLTLVCIILVILLASLSIAAPFISEQILQVDYTRTDPRNDLLPLGAPGHILGTDDLGRDHLARLLYGGQVSLFIAFTASMSTLLIGIAIGVWTGYYGGWVDDIVMWLITTLNSIPSLFLLLIINSVLKPGPTGLIFVLTILGWTGTTRLIRGQTFVLRETEFIVAARAMGASDVRIMFLHIVPNVISLLVISLAQAIGGLILTESALSYLGLGIQPPLPSWGNMLDGAQDYLRTAPHLIVGPGLLIFTTVMCMYIIGDGIRDAFDPKTVD